MAVGADPEIRDHAADGSCRTGKTIKMSRKQRTGKNTAGRSNQKAATEEKQRISAKRKNDAAKAASYADSIGEEARTDSDPFTLRDEPAVREILGWEEPDICKLLS